MRGTIGAMLRNARIRREVEKWRRMCRLYSERFAHPKLIGIPEGKRIVVLSPHPDDDVIGAGGTLSKHHAQGCHITSVVLTDGEAGHPENSTRETGICRRGEAGRAADLIGIDEVVFLGEPDGALASRDPGVSHLRDCLIRTAPDVVYLPMFLDNHPDHRAATALLARAMLGTDLEFTCCAYETWTPLIPNILVDITEHMPIKINAIAAHESQLAHIDYVALVQGLNRYRTAQFSRKIEFAEAFFMSSSSQYLSLWGEVDGDCEVRH